MRAVGAYAKRGRRVRVQVRVLQAREREVIVKRGRSEAGLCQMGNVQHSTRQRRNQDQLGNAPFDRLRASRQRPMKRMALRAGMGRRRVEGGCGVGCAARRRREGNRGWRGLTRIRLRRMVVKQETVRLSFVRSTFEILLRESVLQRPEGMARQSCRENGGGVSQRVTERRDSGAGKRCHAKTRSR